MFTSHNLKMLNGLIGVNIKNWSKYVTPILFSEMCWKAAEKATKQTQSFKFFFFLVKYNLLLQVQQLKSLTLTAAEIKPCPTTTYLLFCDQKDFETIDKNMHTQSCFVFYYKSRVKESLSSKFKHCLNVAQKLLQKLLKRHKRQSNDQTLVTKQFYERLFINEQ